MFQFQLSWAWPSSAPVYILFYLILFRVISFHTQTTSATSGSELLGLIDVVTYDVICQTSYLLLSYSMTLYMSCSHMLCRHMSCRHMLWHHTSGHHMDPIPHDRSHLTGTGPSSYGTGPIVFNKIGPVPTWTFSWIKTIYSLMWARSYRFCWYLHLQYWYYQLCNCIRSSKRFRKFIFTLETLILCEIWDQSHYQLA